MPPHPASYHILDNTFVEENDGLTTPTRRLCDVESVEACVSRSEPEASGYNTLACDGFGLKILNLDRTDPPNYTANGVPRAAAFNTNSGAAFRISSEPRMPQIPVQCQTVGFDPSEYPIHWRLQCRHVLCRHQPVGSYHYRGACEILEDEWQGKSRVANFTIFLPATDPDVDYDYNSNDVGGPVMGGHAILTVVARPQDSAALLRDYVHLRIGGTDPGRNDVLRYTREQLQNRDANILHMVLAIWEHENNFRHFSSGAQTRTTMRFRQKHHQNNTAQPDCSVVFNWPDDPANFPSVSFDWGVGISQYTKILGRVIGRETVWDWRANIRRGINEFLAILKRKHQAGQTWRAWAKRAWKAYNGSGPQADAYATDLEASSEGQQVSATNLADHVALATETAPLAEPPDRSPPTWPPLELGLSEHRGIDFEPQAQGTRMA